MSELDEYDYDLPPELIAQQPLRNRADARLLLVQRKTQSLTHAHVRDLPELLDSGDCLVLNDTRVIPARLVGRRTATGGRWSGLFLSADARGDWLVLGKTRGKMQPGETVTLEDRAAAARFSLTLLAKLDGGAWAARRHVPNIFPQPQTLPLWRSRRLLCARADSRAFADLVKKHPRGRNIPFGNPLSVVDAVRRHSGWRLLLGGPAAWGIPTSPVFRFPRFRHLTRRAAFPTTHSSQRG